MGRALVVAMALVGTLGCGERSVRRGRDRSASALAATSPVTPPRPESASSTAVAATERETRGDGEAAAAQVIYDAALDVTWLADANFAATERFGLDGDELGASGSMTYRAALRWVARMNERRHLGRSDWTLPTVPDEDDTCDRRHAHTFGFGCKRGALAAVYSRASSWPASAVQVPPNAVGRFRDLQPYLYWSGSRNTHHTDHVNGYSTFSFDNGFQGANVDDNRIHVLPMTEGDVAAAPGLDAAARRRLGDATVYDPGARITWLADGNLAARESFGVTGIAASGAMTHATAERWVAAMNRAEGGRGHLGVTSWQLPPTPRTDPSCSLSDYGFECRASALGALYYGLLGKRTGEPVAIVPDRPYQSFRKVKPYLYWSCQASKQEPRRCGDEPPRDGYQWSFSFGNGFTGTTIVKNRLYVMVYHPGRHDAR